MKIKILENVEYSFTGSNVFEQIQDKSTPNMDLLVRESLQNTCDAIKEDEPYGIVKYNFMEFEGDEFYSLFDGLEGISFEKDHKKHNFLSISDENTVGLLGNHLKETPGAKNLYNIAYDIMKNDKQGNAGGSWGIGKSVFYRFGLGFCLFYTRTFENNIYINKLTITYIEDEKNINRKIIKENNRGIAFFGDIDKNGKAMPIYDEMEIKSILGIFNEEIYSDRKTGTKIIIPFIDEKKFIGQSINRESGYTNSNFVNYLKIAIQRWYFPRICNKKYNGKSIIPYINNKEVELNKFFKTLQDMYNGDCKGAIEHEVKSKNPNISLGKLYVKKFNAQDVYMTSPYNLPSPYSLFDIVKDNTTPIIGYLRQSGMIINYETEKWDSVLLEEDEFIIGLLLLDDDSTYNDEVLGNYVRKTEKSNHRSWEDANLKEFPNFSEKAPIRRLFNNVKAFLKQTYKEDKETTTESSSSKLKRKLGKLLLPPSGFGDGAEVTPPTPGNSSATLSKTKNNKIEFRGFRNNNLLFVNMAYLKKDEMLEYIFYVQSGSSKYTISEWIDNAFLIPFKLSKIIINNIMIGKDKLNGSVTLDLENAFEQEKSIKKSISFKCLGTKNEIYGFVFKNINTSNLDIRFNLDVEIKPIDNAYSLSMTSKIIK